MSRRSKPTTLTEHAAERLRERYGIALDAEQVKQLGATMRQGKSILMGRNADGTEKHLVQIVGQAIYVVFNPKDRCIITFPPRGSSFQALLKGMPALKRDHRPKRYKRTRRWEGDHEEL